LKIYTRAGDDGSTGLYGGDRVSKTSPRIQAIGDVDELNALIGLSRTEASESPLDPILYQIQNWLFDLGAELASPPGGKFTVQSINASKIEFLEQSIDSLEETLPPLKAFILPGGTRLSALLHLARAGCRRAERSIWDLNGSEPVSDSVLQFVNRLSDWLFVASRTANHLQNVQDIEWKSTAG